MRRSSVALLPLLALSSACVDSVTAPFSARVTVPDDVQIGWAESYNGTNDGLGLLIPRLTAMVYDSDTNYPLEKIEIEVISNYPGVLIIPDEAVKQVDPPEVPADVTSPADIRDYCTDEEGNFDNTEEWCAWYWDADSGAYYDFGSDYADAGGYAPTLLRGVTDGGGLLTFNLYVDRMPSDSSGEDVTFSNSQVRVSIGVSEDVFDIAVNN